MNLILYVGTSIFHDPPWFSDLAHDRFSLRLSSIISDIITIIIGVVQKGVKTKFTPITTVLTVLHQLTTIITVSCQ